MVKIIQNYTLHEQIGEGEYGKVYRGIDGRNGKEVAAKVILARRFKDNPKLEECTLNEIQVLSRIDSPYIVRFIQILKTVNNFYFFYEFCNGGTLDQEIRKSGYLKEPKILEYLEQLLEAFRVLTANNIMHRDLKPSNIMVHNGKLKLGDFGFCKSLENQRDLAQTMLGSPIYMAPEVLRGEIYTIKADIWSMGVVIYEMVYGFCPYQESSIARLINLQQNQELQFNKDINPISASLQDLLKRMLVKDHFKRISWEELLSYSVRSGKLFRVSQQIAHYRALSELNRMPRRESENGSEKENSKQPLEGKFFKKKSKADEETQIVELHQNLTQIMRTVDKVISDNHCPDLTCQLALKIYKIVAKEHVKLGNRKQYAKERTDLSQAISQIESLLEGERLIETSSLLNNLRTKDSPSQSLSKLTKLLESEEPPSFTPMDRLFGEIQLRTTA